MSASSTGPVEIGFRYSTPPPGDLLFKALQSSVETTDLPTFVFDPYI